MASFDDEVGDDLVEDADRFREWFGRVAESVEQRCYYFLGLVDMQLKMKRNRTWGWLTGEERTFRTEVQLAFMASSTGARFRHGFETFSFRFMFGFDFRF